MEIKTVIYVKETALSSGKTSLPLGIVVVLNIKVDEAQVVSLHSTSV